MVCKFGLNKNMIMELSNASGLVWINEYKLRGIDMPFWQRSLVLLAAVIGVSFIFSIAWHSVFGFSLPGYVSGVVGGITAVAVWDILKRVKPKQ
jgi:hypothetical protein